ncbi:energy transducer TonB [Pseudoxanthomonas sp.]|uniref:energy transducer TonB n=1 Tax=Pseudoxanthomonas sp. TaxID=1871049 RepID=UPI002612549F|nr:energy transducer TonB [Pseudoxanthomonas sp.]WDS37078.1 MAG: energy transducer TonB [Pseudoxanthomonas sp.]
MSRSQTEIDAELQHGTAEQQQDKPTNPLIWLLLLAAVLVAGVWWFGVHRGNEAPITADTTTPGITQPQADASVPPAKAAKAEASRKEAIRKPVIANRAPSLMAGTAQPKYPPSALRAGASGTVTLNVQVDPQGRPSEISIAQRSGNRDLDRAALKAANDWRFQPAMHNGKAVAAAVKVPVEFSAQ